MIDTDTLDIGNIVNVFNNKLNGEEFLEGTAIVIEHLEENDGICSHLKCMVQFGGEEPVQRIIERKRAVRAAA